jgi:uncharacterized protein YdeI (YjbR/CyaY-like superfamily)
MSELTHKNLPIYSFKTQEEFYTWLAARHTDPTPFWLRYYKKDSKKPTIVHTDAVDVALCWGWIDGLANKYDDESYLVRFTPRRPKSVWSKINVAKVEKLIASGKMQPAGLVHIEAAQKDGRWEAAYASPAEMKLPQEFLELVKTDAGAWEFFQSLNKANTFAIGYRLATAKSAEKRTEKMQKIFAMLTEKKKFH